MSQTPKAFLDMQLSDVELPEGLAFAFPEEGAADSDENDEKALSEFLREFEDQNDPVENVVLFSVDEDE